MITQDGKIYIFSGKSRTGKTARAVLLEKELQKRFVIAWDPEAQWCTLKGFKKITSIIQLREIVKAGRAGKYAFVSNGSLKDDFEKVCACVFHYAMFFGESLFVAEELADVTSQAKAGENWGKVIRRGLKRGLSIMAISQRWQEADKTAIGNASEAFIFLPLPKDAPYVAAMLGLNVETVKALEKLEFIHWFDFGQPQQQYLPFAKAKSKKT